MTAKRRTRMIDKIMEATMNEVKPKKPGKRAKAQRSTAELLCLLATYEAYGRGIAKPGCLHALTEAGGER